MPLLGKLRWRSVVVKIWMARTKGVGLLGWCNWKTAGVGRFESELENANLPRLLSWNRTSSAPGWF